MEKLPKIGETWKMILLAFFENESNVLVRVQVLLGFMLAYSVDHMFVWARWFHEKDR